MLPCPAGKNVLLYWIMWQTATFETTVGAQFSIGSGVHQFVAAWQISTLVIFQILGPNDMLHVRNSANTFLQRLSRVKYRNTRIHDKKENIGSGGIRTRASEETGA